MLLLVLLVFWFAGAYADVPTCNGVVQFNPPADLDQWTWYPSNFTGTSPPLYPNGYSCTYQINVPQGWSATIILSVNMTIPIDNAVSVRVIDQNRVSEAVYSTSNEHFFFVAPGGRIHLDSRESNVRFGFAVKWLPFYAFKPWQYNVTVAQPQPVVNWAYDTYPIQITAETRVSLVVVPPDEDYYLEYLRGIMIYDGPDFNSTCLGNGLQLYYSRKQWVSTGKQMTVMQLRPFYQMGNTMLVFQDYENTKDIVQFQGISCPNPQDCGGVISMDATRGPVALISTLERSDSGAEYITGLSGNGQLDVYIGGKTNSKSNLIASYSVNSSSQYFPQEFLGYVRTYVLTGGTAVVAFSRRSQVFVNSAAVGRKGFMASRSYKLGAASQYEDVYDFIGSNYTAVHSYPVFNFLVNIKEADFTGNSTLSIVVNNRGKTIYSEVFSQDNLQLPQVISSLGTDLSVTYRTFGQATSGYYLDFELQKSSAQFGLFALIALLLAHIY